MDWFRGLCLEGKIAADSFIRSYSKLNPTVAFGRTYPHFIKAFRKYRNILFKLDSLQLEDIHLFKECPACPGKNDSNGFFYVTVDGNYRLCRKSNRGKSTNFREPEISHFFIKTAAKETKGEILKDGCGIQAEAGKTVAARYKNVDVTGIVMATCAKHDFILNCSNLLKGERNIDIDNVLAPIFRDRSNGVLYYDIVCKYGKGAKVIIAFIKTFLEKRNITGFHN